MPFTSPFFLSIILPTLVGGYFLVPRSWRTPFLLCFSLLFYLWIEPIAFFVMVALAATNYGLAKLAEKRKSLALASAIAIDVGTLLLFKYNRMAIAVLGIGLPGFAMAAGMSFYIFQLISYVVDVGGKKTKAGSFVDLLLYVCFLPKVPCGPIARFVEFSGNSCDAGCRNVASGFRLFFTGLAKKALIADMLARVVDPVFDTPVTQIPCAYCWLGAVSYSLQIYFDFSGYSDMAIGLARIFNYKLPVNFDFPYASRSLQEFWRRWHMSLSFWFRDYLYKPLGGSRCGVARACLNTMIVFVLCGMWHGSSLTFVIWGAIHGLVLVFERLWLRKVLTKSPSVLANAYLLFVVGIGWVFFRSPSIGFATAFLKNMFCGNVAAHAVDFVVAAKFTTYGEALILSVALAGAFPAGWRLLSRLDKWTRGVFFAIVAALAYIFAMTGTVAPGIYENF